MATMTADRSQVGTWIRTVPPVEVIRLSQTDDGYQAVVDRPGAMRFREPATVSTSPGEGGPRAGWYRVEVAEGEFIEIATDETPAPLRRVVPLETIGLDEWCGWYDAEDRTVLLTQIPRRISASRCASSRPATRSCVRIPSMSAVWCARMARPSSCFSTRRTADPRCASAATSCPGPFATTKRSSAFPSPIRRSPAR